jgi:uncharacterized protein (DUF2249 family)
MNTMKQARPPLEPSTDSFPSDAPIVELDVRDDLRNGGEPLAKIMATVGTLEPADVLHLRATFEPVPLLRVMTKRGFRWRVKSHATDDWSVWFYRQATPTSCDIQPAETLSTAPATPPTAEDQSPAATDPVTEAATAATLAVPTPASGDVLLDVRDMEPPEPLVRTLETLERLPAGTVLIQINLRVPQLLLPILQERGYAYTIDESQTDRVLVRIWRP